ncbi:glycosyltransferase family 39 protein [Candidatus Synechococcus spongiarum]|uniref:glycosyltransferase family 39 protein n=1 Tax=Candidatus Synechococcus spongiarum TaxID=431041 RepID=UPI001268E63A|nr:glycosyltransferase family 39 protein [Candidatus Synechococcus spongiarum]
MLLILYFIFNLIEQNLKPGLTHDALQQLRFIDKWQWQWGYMSTQPPLYHWLFKIIVDVCNFLNLNFKFADSFFRQCLVMIDILIGYLILREYKIDQNNAIFSVFGLFLITDIGWSLQYNYTHTVLAITTILFFILQFIRLLNRSTLRNYYFVGLSIACAVLSKYNTILTIAGILLASLSIKSARSVIFRFKFLITSSTASIIFLPHFWWMLSTGNPLIIIRKVLKVENVNDSILPDSILLMLTNLSSILALLIAQILPLLISLIIIFRLRYNWLKMIITEDMLLGRSFVITILIHLVFMLISDARTISIHWLLPAVLLLPLALPLAAFKIGKLRQYAKGIFISALIFKIICFVVLTIIDFWRLHIIL